MRVVLVAFLIAMAPSAVGAQEASATPSPSPAPHFALSVKGSNVVAGSASGGPGIVPPEGPAFASGLPLAPMTPYDWFSGAPLTPGVAGVAQYTLTARYRMPSTYLEGRAQLAIIDGDVTTASYWGEPLQTFLDPHAGRTVLPYRIAFPSAAGLNNVAAGELVLPSTVTYGANDQAWKVRGGVVNLAQTDHFVFAQPPITSVAPSVGVQTAETLGPGMPTIDAWDATPTVLPLLGGDAMMKRGDATFEATDALLPALPGTAARALVGSVVVAHGDNGPRYSAEIANVHTSGDPVSTTTLFGTDLTFFGGPQGVLVTSNLADQRQTIAGIRAFIHPRRGYDALAEIGRAWYNALGAGAPAGTAKPGNYDHFALTRHFNAQDDAGIEYYRFDPTYATAILPYGIPENVWSIAWSWPGPWLKSNYQLVDNSIVGVNRAGFRAHADMTRGKLQLRASYAAYRQLAPITVRNGSELGFVEGFFLAEPDRDATIGTQRQAALYGAWHFGKDDLAFDGVYDALHRPYAGSRRIDYVDMRYPQIVLSLQHHFSKRAIGVAGYGRYSADGTWASTPVLGIESIAFLGAQMQTGPATQLMVQLRRSTVVGLPSIPSGPTPDMRATSIIVDQRVSF